MAEEKKDTFPWIQLIATVGTIVAALIGITPYILKLNQPSTPQTPTIVIVTLPPAVITPTPATTTLPVTMAETTTVPTQTTVVATTATTGPPPTGTETPVTTTGTPVTTTPVETTVPTTAATTLPAGSAIQVSVNATSVPQGGTILATVSTDPGVPQVTITLRNSTIFESQPVSQDLVQGMVTLSLDTAPYAPGDYTIFAAIPGTTSEASASFVIT